MAKAYKQAGVDIEAGYQAVALMKEHVQKTMRPEVLGGIGGFGGLFDLSALGYRQPVLISGTDGVGTKLKLAFLLDRHDTIGIDCVAMCVNDIIVQGAEPLVFPRLYRLRQGGAGENRRHRQRGGRRLRRSRLRLDRRGDRGNARNV